MCRILPFEAIQSRELLIPVALQASGDKPVFGIDHNIAATCKLDLVASPF